jgi:hypothetical protein
MFFWDGGSMLLLYNEHRVGWLVGTPTFISDPVVILHLGFGITVNTKPWVSWIDRSIGNASKLSPDHLPWGAKLSLNRLLCLYTYMGHPSFQCQPSTGAHILF